MRKIHKYSINISWSAHVNKFLAKSAEWPSLSGVASTRTQALDFLLKEIDEELVEMRTRPAPYNKPPVASITI